MEAYEASCNVGWSQGWEENDSKPRYGFTLPCHHVPVNSSEKSKDSKVKAEFPDNYEGIFVKVGR